MKLTYSQLSAAYEALQYLVNQKLPFKSSLLISKNYASISKEYEFYEQQERKFAMEFLVFDPTTQNIEQVSPGAFKIKEGKYEEWKQKKTKRKSYRKAVCCRYGGDASGGDVFPDCEALRKGAGVHAP